jgi:lauroyl/myristoyl acyltransferase
MVSLFPVPVAYRLAGWCGRFRYHWACRWKPRDVALRTMYLAMRLGVSDDAARAYLKRYFELESCEDLDCWICPRLTSETIGKVLSFDGFERLAEAMDAGKGLILTTGHVKGVWIGLVALALRGYKMALLKRQRVEIWYNPVERWFYGRRMDHLEKLGYQFIFNHPPNSFTLGRATSAVRQNRILFTMVDLVQPGQHNDVEVEFLHQHTLFPQGPALIARATGAPMVDFWIQRGKEQSPAVFAIGELVNVGRDYSAALQVLADRFTAYIEHEPGSWNPWLIPGH